MDKTTLHRHPMLTAQWCLADEIPDIPTRDDHTKVHVYGGVSLLTGHTDDHIWVTFYPGKRLLVIHNRGAQYKGACMEDVVCKVGERRILTPQPSHSSELNPQECIWKWLRRVVTYHHWLATLREQSKAIRNFFRYLGRVQNQVVRLCDFKCLESLVALM